jgi:(E)-4-hydroxy-3-methyl-but-2-enyl pyrophosphate reductase
VDRAIDIVDMALQVYGAPVYVRHEIVHNRHVVDDLRAKGAVFIDELKDVPTGAVVIFSAHGVSPAVRQEAKDRGLRSLDATCPLVTKVHTQAKRYAREGYTVVLIGHAGHEEVVGTRGEAPEQTVLVETVEDVAMLELPAGTPVAYITQTTLSVDETGEIIYGPDIVSRGFVFEDESQQYLDEARKVVLDTLALKSAEVLADWSEVKLEVRRVLRRFFNKTIERRPVILPLILEM